MIVRPLTNVSLYRIDHLQCRCVFVLELGDAGHRALTRTGAWHLSALDVVFPRQHRSSRMAKGTVKWFNATKGYGFIQPTGGGGRDVFVHISAVEKAGLSTLNEGQSVEYEEVPNKGKTTAENLKVG
jgi:cold shock protein